MLQTPEAEDCSYLDRGKMLLYPPIFHNVSALTLVWSTNFWQSLVVVQSADLKQPEQHKVLVTQEQLQCHDFDDGVRWSDDMYYFVRKSVYAYRWNHSGLRSSILIVIYRCFFTINPSLLILLLLLEYLRILRSLGETWGKLANDRHETHLRYIIDWQEPNWAIDLRFCS